MDKEGNYTEIPAEFKDIAPYNDLQFREKLESLVNEPGFKHAISYVVKDIPYDEFVKQLLAIRTQEEFQSVIMFKFLEMLVKKTSNGVSSDGLGNIDRNKNYTFISNHRDIVLDAALLNLCLLRAGLIPAQIAIGNNLLIYDWITDLVKINKSFIVKRDVKMTEALQAARQLSAYIHYTINTLHDSVWIAQREGRTKDSNDRTQESLIKMLSLSGDGNVKENILSCNLCPVSISYEYDPNDYLKAREFLLRQRDPEFKKSHRDDLLSMETGIVQNKGRIMFRVGHCINDELAKFESDNRQEIIRYACALIDEQIHRGYEIYPGNYIAYDELNGTNQFSDKYTEKDLEVFDNYIDNQLNKVDVENVTPDEREYMRQMMLNMYANPLKNHISH